MNVAPASLSAVVLATLLAACGSRERPPPAASTTADVVIVNADIRTMDPAHPVASALAIANDRILKVGSDADIQPLIGAKTRRIDAQGNTVLPGLIDSHIHVAEGALARGGCSLDGTELTIQKAAPRILDCFKNDKESAWLVVTDVNPAGFKATRAQLDAIERQRPLFLWGQDGHTAWVNSRALELARITRGTKDPDDGRIERDAQGEPSGFLVDGGVGLVLAVMEKPTPEKRLEKLRWILPQLHAVGITSYFEANTDAETVDAYVALAKRFELDARVTIALESDGTDSDAEFARLDDLRARVGQQPLLRADFIKLFADGVLEYPTQTAALLEPYRDAHGRPTNNKAKLYLEPAAMTRFIRRADQDGFNVHVHAIGDAAVRETLDAFAAARAAGSKRRYSIAHLQLIDPADLPRFAQLDVLASLQLLWAQPDNYSVDAVQKYLGPERGARQYPARSLVDAKATIAGGSDWDVSSFNPFEAIATAMSRRNPLQPERAPLVPAEALTLDEMLLAYTLNAAKLIGRDDEIGSLTEGKLADIAILPVKFTQDTTADQVRNSKPSQVLFGGESLPMVH
ncbi:MAG TPA: amidohydrolase [Steroidobacteraceae bacterium]|nr:amidohydrolase [Steroidobacteraceae bacterium]